jgi:hypothetical protein
MIILKHRDVVVLTKLRRLGGQAPFARALASERRIALVWACMPVKPKTVPVKNPRMAPIPQRATFSWD